MKIKIITLAIFQFFYCIAKSQTIQYTSQQIHSHNNYQQSIPLIDAINNKVGSIEIDILLWKDTLWVGHDLKDLINKKSLVQQYLIPLDSIIRNNNNSPYADKGSKLQILIDIKTQADITISKLIKDLKSFTTFVDNNQIEIVITGNQPDMKTWKAYPYFIKFDGQFGKIYDSYSLSRIPIFSGDLSQFTKWNGKGVFVQEDKKRLDSIIYNIHKQNKKIRFWNAPDNINSWIQLMKLNVDYLNTDKVYELSNFIFHQKQNKAVSKSIHDTVVLNSIIEKINKRPKNIIFIIGDGMGLAQIHAGYITNRNALNLYKIKNIGLSITHSADAFNTDSAPGATAFSTGEKTNNRFVGVDTNGNYLQNISTILKKQRKKIGIITSGDITDATPAAFYAHQTNRENSSEIFKELQFSTVDYAAGSGNYQFDSIQNQNIHLSKTAGLSIEDGRGDWLSFQLNTFLKKFSKSPQGFFLMLEGAQVDYGGHANSLQYISNEVNDLDKTIGVALEFANKNQETLVIITSDHETGGLTLLDGNLKNGNITGQFSTSDHTALPALVFAYGPKSELFKGVYQNNEIFQKMLKALGVNSKK